jgi:hypothetical protein
MLKKLIITLAAVTALSAGMISCSADWEDDYPWAVDGVNYCLSNGIMSGDEYGDLLLGENLTRAQMAKILTVAFGLESTGSVSFFDVEDWHWSYDYVSAIEDCMKKKGFNFNGDEYVTREEFAATMMLAAGLGEGNLRNSGLLSANFEDAWDVDPDYNTLLTIAVERAYMTGYDGYLYPKGLMTRAEVCTLLQRVVQSQKGEITLNWYDLGVQESWTPLIGAAEITVEQAQAWARAHDAAERFIEIAPTYWYYGDLFGLRPEILYAQAAKETGFGKYGGAVLPEMNNWAGIKIKNPIGDRTEDHESFATPDDGVRAHFNHMSAYVGLAPIGEVHDRYYVVKSISWAGTIENLEALGGRWCPDLYYGYSILHEYLEKMAQY